MPCEVVPDHLAVLHYEPNAFQLADVGDWIPDDSDYIRQLAGFYLTAPADLRFWKATAKRAGTMPFASQDKPALQGKTHRRERGRDGSQGLVACAAWDLGRRLKPTLLKGG
jgi:hypothetical protein